MSPDPSAPAVALPSVASLPAERARPDMRLLGLLALGHMVIDINQGSLPAILPVLKDALNLSYAATGVIVLTANVTSSMIQPLFGYFADKTARRWLLPLSVLLSSLGLAFIGLAPSYAAVLALVMITGFGVAAYHPEGYRTATAVAGDRKATGVSIFSTGGNVGIALGPPLITALLIGFGPAGSLGMLVPGLLVAGLLIAVLPRLSAPPPAAARARANAAGARTMVGAMSLLILVVAIRSWTQLGFTTFMPFYWKDVLHGDPAPGRHPARGVPGLGRASARSSRGRWPIASGCAAPWWASSSSPRRSRCGFLLVSGGPLVFVLLAPARLRARLHLHDVGRAGPGLPAAEPRHGLGADRGLRHRRGRDRRDRARMGGRPLGAHHRARHLGRHAAGRLRGRPVPAGSPDR